VTEEEVDRSLAAKREDLGYFCRGTRQVPADWAIVIDGAKILGDIFREISENRVVYEKTTHSVALTDWLIQNNPEALREVAEMLAGLLRA
jgi:hypothetical protein